MGPRTLVCMRHGYTLLELVIALALGALLIGLAWPGSRALRDAFAVRAARAETVAALAHVRSLAIAGGGASLVVHADSALLLVLDASDSVHQRLEFGRDHGVLVEGGAADSFRIHYDALGLGRVASRTLRMTRGDASAGVSVSAYGRVRPW